MEKTIEQENAIREAIMKKKAEQVLLNSGDLLSTYDICQLVGLTTDIQLIQWIKDRKIFSVYLNNTEYYPVYAFDAHKKYQPLEVINKIIKIFGEKCDGFMLAIWFSSANGYLGGKRPQDMIVREPDSVIYASKIQADGIQHG